MTSLINIVFEANNSSGGFFRPFMYTTISSLGFIKIEIIYYNDKMFLEATKLFILQALNRQFLASRKYPCVYLDDQVKEQTINS